MFSNKNYFFISVHSRLKMLKKELVWTEKTESKKGKKASKFLKFRVKNRYFQFELRIFAQVFAKNSHFFHGFSQKITENSVFFRFWPSLFRPTFFDLKIL